MNNAEVRLLTDDINMRAALWEWLMAQRPMPPGVPPLVPDAHMIDDQFIQDDLKRILFPKRRWWRFGA